MKLDALRLNQLSPTAFDWYLRYLHAIDDGDIATFANHLHPDVTFQINNHLPVHGRNAAAIIFTRYARAIGAIEHELLNIFGADASFAVEMLCHYTRRDGSRFTMPAAVFIDRDETGLILAVRTMDDARPVDDAFNQASP